MDNDATAVIMPEIILYNTLKSIFNIVKKDFNESESEKDSILYSYFGLDDNGNRLSWETFDYFEQAKELFIRRNIEVNLGYNLEKSAMGVVHILLPEETGRDLGIGADENYQPNVIEHQSSGRSNYKAQFTNTFDANYNLMITSENTMEVLLLYNFIKASFISLYYHLELSGLRLPKLSGRDVQFQSDLVPTNVFHRSLNVSFMYEVTVPDLFSKRIIRAFSVTGINSSNTNE